MKCEHCGKNEVTFVYRSNINGHVEERHLCGACAEKLGYSHSIEAQSRRMMEGFFGDRFWASSLRGGFFEPVSGLMGRRSWLLEDPFEDFFADMPALRAAGAQKEEQQPAGQEPLVSQEEQGRFSYLRQRNALRLEMKKAVRQEDFERAAQLRDELRALEEAHTRESA